VWADHEALRGPIAEIDTTAVLTRHDWPIGDRGIETGAGVWVPIVVTTAVRAPMMNTIANGHNGIRL
jgi:hypothetical protein